MGNGLQHFEARHPPEPANLGKEILGGGISHILLHFRKAIGLLIFFFSEMASADAIQYRVGIYGLDHFRGSPNDWGAKVWAVSPAEMIAWQFWIEILKICRISSGWEMGKKNLPFDLARI